MDDRLTEIEIQLTHVSHEHDQLNDVVIEQSRTIDNLNRRLSALEARMRSIIATLQTPDGGSSE